MQILENAPLAPLTTLQVGGPARYFARASTPAEVCQAVEWAKSRALPLFVLGGGSNLVVSDDGFPGLVLKIEIAGLERRREDSKEIFDAGAGVDWDGLVASAVAAGCAGLECMSGIPGTVGGTPVQNVGAYGQEVADTITEVEVLDLRDGQLRTLCKEACGFAYRSSVFNTGERGRFIILRVRYALDPGGTARIAYRDLKEHFGDRPSPTLSEVREAVRTIRLSKGMLIIPGDPDARSVGSFFKNPVLEPSEFERVNALAFRLTGSPIPRYPAPGQRCKLPAAWLVEHAGFPKGYARGNVGISRKHALAIVNRGGATAAEVLALKAEIQRAVLDTFGVHLTAEPVFVGFE